MVATSSTTPWFNLCLQPSFFIIHPSSWKLALLSTKFIENTNMFLVDQSNLLFLSSEVFFINHHLHQLRLMLVNNFLSFVTGAALIKEKRMRKILNTFCSKHSMVRCFEHQRCHSLVRKWPPPIDALTEPKSAAESCRPLTAAALPPRIFPILADQGWRRWLWKITRLVFSLILSLCFTWVLTFHTSLIPNTLYISKPYTLATSLTLYLFFFKYLWFYF